MARSASQLSAAKGREASNKGLAAPKNMTQKYGANAQHVYSAQNLKSSMTGGVPAPNLKDPYSTLSVQDETRSFFYASRNSMVFLYSTVPDPYCWCIYSLRKYYCWLFTG